MSVNSTTLDLPDLRRSALRDIAPVLLVGVVVLGLIFRAEAVAAVQVWNDSTAYSHCYFVLPIALYLAWDRRANLVGLRVEPLPWLGLLAIPGVIAWMAADRMGIMEGRQLVAMSFVQLLFLAVLGKRLWWALSAPLLYLYFLVPFGAFLTPLLQTFTLKFSLIGLTVIGIPFYADEFLIDTPSGRYLVAEACAGLRFLIASVAFGVLYSLLIYRSWRKRVLFMLASIAIPIIANGFRALGIVVLGSILGSAEAAATDHVLYGWIFFSIVILLLILAGMPFREDQTAPPAAPPLSNTEAPDAHPASMGTQLRAGLATVLVVLLAGSAAAVSGWLDARAAPVAATPAPIFHNAAGCYAVENVTVQPPGTPGAHDPHGSRATQAFDCGPVRLLITLQLFSTRANPAALIQARRELTNEGASDEMEYGTLAVPGGIPANWRLTIGSAAAVMSATATWIDGAPSRGGLLERIHQARSSIDGASVAPVLVTVALELPKGSMNASNRDRAQRLLSTFIASQPALGAQVVVLARIAAGKEPLPKE